MRAYKFLVKKHGAAGGSESGGQMCIRDSTKAESAVDTVFEGLKQALAAGERIELRGFGVFSVRARKTGIGRNPRTGTEVNITPGKAVRFKPGKELHTIATAEAPKS